MDGNLDEIKTSYMDKLKRLKLLEAGIDITDVDTYIKYIKAADEKEIEKQAQKLVADIKQHHFTSAIQDKNTWKPF